MLTANSVKQKLSQTHGNLFVDHVHPLDWQFATSESPSD